MDKPAPTEHALHEIVKKRWSPRAFADQSVSKDSIARMLEAARWTMSSYGDQPWAFVIATKDQPELYSKVLGCLIPFNQDWAKSAPVLILTFAHKVFAHNNKPNLHGRYDLGAAMAQLTAQATADGLYVHQMAGIEYDKIRTEFGIPDDWEPMSAAAVGFIGDPASLPDSLKEKELAPRSRKPMESFVFGSKWGETSSLVPK